VGGATAVDRAKRLWCSTDSESAKKDLLNGTSDSFSSLESDCDDEKISLMAMLTDVFGIDELPHIIREDGLVSEGFPVDFDSWFEKP
jgi:thiol:disulfide interchange protein DsbC